nr:MAG TPA: Protein of unknown function (DUF1642) [Caudoviricetes sp.]
MNVKELIEKYEYLNHDCFRRVDTSKVLKDLKQLDEQQKPVVPQFVADWYEERKNNIDFEIWHYLHTFSSQKEDEFKKWMNKLGLKQIQTLVNMHQFGYEVEKEPKYIVKMKATKQPLFYNNMYEKIFFSMGDLATRFTRKQLEEVGLGWVFDCEGIEIEEVTE